MKRMVLVSLFVCAGLYATGPEMGMVSYVEGEVLLLREDREPLPVDFGMEVREYDLIRTGRDGYVVVDFLEEGGISGSVEIRPGSVFQVVREEEEKTTAMELFAGQVFLKVKRLAGTDEVVVRTEGAAMGVRGTEFEVITSAGGDLLVVCTEGRVACRAGEGETAFAEPGKAVERRVGERLRTVLFRLAEAEDLKRNWLTERMEAFRANAPRVFSLYARLYRERKRAFDEAYGDLLRRQEVVNEWIRRYKQGRLSEGGPEALRERKELAGVMLRLRKELFLFSRVYYRLIELVSYYHEGVGHGRLDTGEGIGSFVAQVEKEARELASRLQYVRFVMFLFEQRGRSLLGESLLFED